MDNLYIGQTEGRITYDLGIDVSLITSCELWFRKPDWTEFSKSATFTTGTTVYYDLESPSMFTVTDYGYWTYWPHLVFADTHEAPGEPRTFKVSREGY